MKRILQTTLAAAFLLAFPAFAQTAADSPIADSENNHEIPPTEPRRARLNEAVKAGDIIGMTVRNLQNEKLGKVEDLAVDLQSGRIVLVILSSGGFIGIGDRLTSVPPEALSRDATNKCLVLDADKERMKSAPRFEMSDWKQYSDSNHLSEVYSHYGQDSSFVFIGNSRMNQNQAASLTNSEGDMVTTNREINTTTGHRGTLDGQVGATDGRRTANVIETNVSVTAWSQGDTDGRSNLFLIPESRLGHLQWAGKLRGKSVRNLQDENIGEVEDVLVDMPSGRVVAVIIASGGFLGMSEELSVVPPTALHYSGDWSTLLLDTSKEAFASAPHFKSNQWPDLSQPGYASSVYQAYHVQPYFDSAGQADNTARNARDRGSKTLTPMDQGNSNADIGTTARIRKEIIADKSMSANARNVKIITMDGHVTLRGPVNTEDEKREIGEIATRIALSGNVDNQIEVQITTSSSN